MKLLELFAGTRSIGKVFEKAGNEVFSVEWNKNFENIDLYEDISKLTAETILEKFGRPDVIWASPDCTTFSMAGISHHRKLNPVTKQLEPISEYAKFCDECDKHVIDLIKELKPKYWFIENPRGAMRKMDFMQGLPRYTVTYCQYGDSRMKPTDIWTNHPNPDFLPPCKNGDPCHIAAPRGSRTGTQGLKGSIKRSVIPEKLCEHIYDMQGMKMKYTVAIEEVLRKEYTVEAETEGEALAKIQDHYFNADDNYVLSASDFSTVEFKVVDKEEGNA